jgi:hypothetical protein
MALSDLPIQYILAFGLFSFTSGITNWIAIRMLFDKIPGLYGSGIIEAEVAQIRITAKGLLIFTLFVLQLDLNPGLMFVESWGRFNY